MTIDRIIRSARINAGLTVKAAAEKCGVAEQLMQAWECGVAEPTNEQLAALRGVLDMGGCGVPQPDIPEIDSGESYSAQLMTEYKQCMIAIGFCRCMLGYWFEPNTFLTDGVREFHFES